MNKGKQKGDGRYGFADLFLGDLNRATIIELKYINYAGLRICL